MSTKISKRELFSKHALSAGLGVSALALLPQRPSADTPFTSFPFTATGAPTARTMPDRLGEIKNVKDYGAVGDGSHDDTTNIQACFDAAFGPVGSDRGWTNPELNKAVYFPAGIYKVSGDPALTIQNVQGGRIFGAGMFSSVIRNSTNGARTLWLNGWAYSRMSDIGILCTSTGKNVALEYDGASSQNNLFDNCHFAGNNGGSNNRDGIGCRVGHSGLQVDTTTYLNCLMGGNLYAFTTLP